MKHNPDAFYGVLNIDNQSKLSQSDLLKRYLALLAAGLFQQISRISETETVKFSVPRKMDETGKETYRHLYKFIMGDTDNEAFVNEFDNVMYIGVQQLVSYTIYKIMMKQLLDPKDNDKKINSFINHVTSSALYYMMDPKSGPHITTDIKCNVYLINELIAGGHYMDHCRGNYSMFFEHNSALYYLYVLSLNKDVSIGSIVDQMEAIVLHTLVTTSDLTRDITGVECIKKNMKHEKAKTKRNYSNTDERISNLTNFEKLFHDILFTEFKNKAKINVTITTPLNETLRRFNGQTFEFDMSSDFNKFFKESSNKTQAGGGIITSTRLLLKGRPYKHPPLFKGNTLPHVEVVIARYNENDFKRLLPMIPIDWDITIYNKGSDDIVIPPNDNHNITTINLKNVGRDAHTYLYHIIKNYKNLADVTVCLPGSALDNSMWQKSRKTKAVIKTVKSAYVSVFPTNTKLFSLKDDKDLYNFEQKEYTSTNKSNQDKNPQSKTQLASHRPFGKWYEKMFEGYSVPERFHVNYNCIFAVQKEHVLQRSIKLYRKLIAEVSKSSQPEAVHYIERSWATIFHPFDTSCYVPY
jgi:hypothetical protein